MFVPCPHCGFLVALIVGAEAAQQRCPRCGNPLQEDPPAPAPSVAAEGPVAARIPDPQPRQEATPQRREAGPPAATPVGPEPSRSRDGRPAAPTFARMRASAATGSRRWPGWVAAGTLALLLALQLVLSQRTQLAADAGWRPLVTSVCSVLGCQVPPWREPSAWVMLSRDVVPSPGQPGQLEVTAAFRNQARWPQPMPVLVLSLTDRHGRTVAARALTPDEYAAGGAMDHEPGASGPLGPALLAAGEAARVRFRVHEPASEIVAFSFEFR